MAFSKEKELLENELQNKECYNIKEGGDGGWHYVHRNNLTNKNKTKETYVKIGRSRNKLLQERRISDPEFNADWLSKVWHLQSNETKSKISDTLKGRKRNKIWITNGIDNIYHDVTSDLPIGFYKGRITKPRLRGELAIITHCP